MWWMRHALSQGGITETAEERAWRNRSAALKAWSKLGPEERTARTAPGRAGLMAKLAREVDPDGEMEKRAPDLFAKRYKERVSAHYAAMTQQRVKKARLRREAEQNASAKAAGAAVAPAAPASETTRQSPMQSPEESR